MTAPAACATRPNAWHYDNAATPTKVLMCPTTCDTLRASSGAQVDIAFGCDQIRGILK